MKQESIDRTIQALLFTSEKPLPGASIAEALAIKTAEVDEAVTRINSHLHDTGSPVSIRQIAGGYEFLTLPEFAPYIKKLYKNRFLTRLSRPALEVLAIIAYKQPISKQEVEAIRGVNSDAVYHTLLERKLIKITGRKEAPGRPLLYGSTKEFLQYLGINSMDDLPKIEEIKSILEKDETVESWDDRVEVAKNQAKFEFNEAESKSAASTVVTTLEEDLKNMENEPLAPAEAAEEAKTEAPEEDGGDIEAEGEEEKEEGEDEEEGDEGEGDEGDDEDEDDGDDEEDDEDEDDDDDDEEDEDEEDGEDEEDE